MVSARVGSLDLIPQFVREWRSGLVVLRSALTEIDVVDVDGIVARREFEVEARVIGVADRSWCGGCDVYACVDGSKQKSVVIALDSARSLLP